MPRHNANAHQHTRRNRRGLRRSLAAVDYLSLASGNHASPHGSDDDEFQTMLSFGECKRSSRAAAAAAASSRADHAAAQQPRNHRAPHGAASSKQQRPPPPPPPPRRGRPSKKDNNAPSTSKGHALAPKKKSAFQRARLGVRNCLARMRLDQAFLDAYAGDQYRASRRDLVRPRQELDAAERRVHDNKMAVRDYMRVLYESNGERRIPKDAYDENGELDSSQIICSVCCSGECDDDNDIIMCDGECDRAYHMRCLDPPLTPDDLPKAELDGWLCPACDCWVDCVWDINQYVEAAREKEGDGGEPTSEWQPLHTGSHWKDVFPEEEEAAGLASAPAPHTAEDDSDLLPSEDEDDDDFEVDTDAERRAMMDGDASSSDDDENDSDDDSDDDDSEDDPRGELKALSPPGSPIVGKRRPRRKVQDDEDDDDNGAEGEGDSDSDDFDDSDDPAKLIVVGKRRRANVDYAALNAALFGQGEAYSGEMVNEASDGEWSPTSTRRQV
ncbi:PHD-type domain-containing protein [Pycnococcus provasolii]